MATTTWDEIKRLASDFQRVQLTESSLKLSERNCIELINKLIELDMLKVFHSIDGKEYITDKQIERDIYDELYVHHGRVNQCELQALLNIDITHIERKVSEIVKHDSSLVLILGQIISKEYMNKIAQEINEMLQERSRITIAELTTVYDLPRDFLLEVLTPRVGSIINGNFDGDNFYTLNFVNSQRALLAGALEACIKPIRIGQLVKEYNLETAMVFGTPLDLMILKFNCLASLLLMKETFDSLVSSGQIKGSLFGGKSEMSAVFVPAIYIKAQEQYVMSFFKQNGYIDYSRLKKIGITEPDEYVRHLFKDQQIEYLSSSCFADYYLHQMGEDIEEVLNKEGYCDLSQVLPSILKEGDVNKMATYYNKKFVETSILADTYLFNNTFMKKFTSNFQKKMEKKADEVLKEPQIVLAFRAERAVLANTQLEDEHVEEKKKSKGSKANKKKGATTKENLVEISFIDKATLEQELSAEIEDISEELLEALVDIFLRSLNQQFFELLKSNIEKGLISSSASAEANQSPSKSKRTTMKEMQEKIRMFLLSAKIFEKGVNSFEDTKTQNALRQHLIKTVYSDIVNDMFKFIANENAIAYEEENFNTESRMKLIKLVYDAEIKKKLTDVHQALAKRTSEEIVGEIERWAADSFEFSLKKQDLKREREIVMQQRESTKMSLEKETDPAAVLQQTCMLLYHQLTGTIVNFPGRMVPTILETLKPIVQAAHYDKLLDFQNLIIENLKKSSETTEPADDSALSLSQEIRAIGLNAKDLIKPVEGSNKEN